MKKHVIPIMLTAISLISWLIAYPKLPEQIPIHWDSSGADGYQSKGTAIFTLHIIMIFIYLVMVAVPKIDPKKKNYKYFSKSYTIINYSLIALFFVINMMILIISLGVDIPMERLAGPLVGILFIILGNYMQQAKPNYFMGLRTPWTLSNEDVWRKTHRLGGRMFLAGGLLIFLTVFMPAAWEMYVILSVVVVIVVVPYLYSYLIYKKMAKG